MGEPCGEGSSLAEVARKANHPHQRVAGLHLRESLKRRVSASVVDEDHFVRHADLGEHPRQLVVQRHDVLLFVAKRNDDGDFGIDQC